MICWTPREECLVITDASFLYKPEVLSVTNNDVRALKKELLLLFIILLLLFIAIIAVADVCLRRVSWNVA